MNEPLEPHLIESSLQGTIFAGQVHLFPTVESTNTLAMREGQGGAPHGCIYLAEEQTGGRGRGAHAWHSEPYAGLYLSILLRPPLTPPDALWLSLAAGLAVQQAVGNVTALVADIRWPNDLLLGSRKFGGILTEMSAESDRVRYAVVGIGINVSHNQFPPELQEIATSLRLETDRVVSRQDLLISVLQAINSELRGLLDPSRFAHATQSILERMERQSTWVRGKRVAVSEAEGYTGVTVGLDSRGFLRVETPQGVRIVVSGGVRTASTAD
jgi:BirA family transcriptional regulator, biotin operon repressor / biotin---[acetyl-CoA-carboxylase] ligase